VANLSRPAGARPAASSRPDASPRPPGSPTPAGGAGSGGSAGAAGGAGSAASEAHLAPRPRRDRGRGARSRPIDQVRRGLALLAVLVGVALAATDRPRVCSDAVTSGGQVVRICHTPQMTDGIVLGYGLFVLLLLGPDLAEVGVPGLFTLRRRVDEHESRLETEEDRRELLESQVTTLSARVEQTVTATARAVGVDALNIYVSGDETAGYAAADRSIEDVPTAPAAGAAVVVDRVSRARYTAADLFIRRMRSHPGGPLEGCSLNLYLADETGMMLVPAFEADRVGGGTGWWQVGQGIVGRAWRDRDALVARGAEIMQGLEDLPPARREQYASLAVVVAVPVLNAAGRPIAVLRASTSDPDSPVDQPEGIEALVTHADAISRIIVDLLGWESDG
jgi:hypothetical protein